MPVEATQHSLKETRQFTAALEDKAFVKSSTRMRSYRYRHSSIRYKKISIIFCKDKVLNFPDNSAVKGLITFKLCALIKLSRPASDLELAPPSTALLWLNHITYSFISSPL